jgi:phospholipid/cholesterol/gamma-HCH transport system substrate-binding protein
VKISNEAKVGALSILALVLFVLGFNYLKGKSLFSKDMILTATYKNLQGLQGSNPVVINGLTVGKVSAIETDKSMTKLLVKLKITKDVLIPNNSFAVIKTNPLGTPSIEILLGNSTTFVKNEDSIATQVSNGLFGDLLGKVDPIMGNITNATGSADSLIDNLNTVISTNNKANIAAMLQNFNKISASLITTTASLNDLIASQKASISGTLGNVNGITGNFKGNNGKINEIVSNFEKTSQNVADLNLKKTLDTLDVAINNLKGLLATMNNQNGTIGKLFNDPTLYKNLASTANKLNFLLDDVRVNPKRYINISVFGKKQKVSNLQTPLPDTLNSPYYVEKINP